MVEVGGHGANLLPWMHREHVYRCSRSHKTPADTSRSPWQLERNMWIHTQLCRIKERREKERKRTRPAAEGWEAEAGRYPASGAPVGDRWEHFEIIREWGSWSVTIWMEWEPHRPSQPWPHTQDRDASPPVRTVAGSWRQDGRAIPGGSQDCFWLWGDGLRGWEGGNPLWGMPLEESGYEAGCYPESRQGLEPTP